MTQRQPDLMNEWGTRFYGRAKNCGDLWWYEERMSDGTIKRHPLLPVSPTADEIERLRHDIERHVQLATDQQQEIERLQAVNRRAKALADEHAKEVVRLRAALKRAELKDTSKTFSKDKA